MWLCMDAAVDGFGRGGGVDVAEVDVAGVDVAEVDVAGVDVAGVDVAGVDVAGRDVAGRDVAGRDVVGRDVAGRDVAGRDVAREVWGKWLVFVVSLDRVSCRRMCEGCHPDAGVGLGMKGREGVERWGRWVKKGGQGVCVGNGAMRYRVLMEEAIISPTTAALWL